MAQQSQRMTPRSTARQRHSNATHSKGIAKAQQRQRTATPSKGKARRSAAQQSIVMFSEAEQARILRLLWAEAGYKPTEGYFPVFDLEGNERTVSRGQREIHECTNRLVMELLKHIFRD